MHEEAAAVQDYMFNPKVEFLLIDYSDEKVEVLYDSNPYPWKMPKIGPRPPYYCNPRYEQEYPII